MENLSLRDLVRAAPAAAAVRHAGRDGLISTAEFLKHVEREYLMKPVLAVQGKGHIDASNDSPEKMGRHFVVAATAGEGIRDAIFLLNSHQKHRRAHVGYGFWDTSTESFLIGPSTPLQRWKGFADPLQALIIDWESKLAVETALREWGLSFATREAFAKSMAKSGYTPFVEARPSWSALLGDDSNAFATAFEAVAKMRKGNLAAPTKDRRNIKGIRRPDGLFHAGLVALYQIVSMAVAMRRLSSRHMLPLVRPRLPRP